MKVALICTFYHRPELYPAIAEAIRAQTRQPDELWLMCEDREDYDALIACDWGVRPAIVIVPVPRENGEPTVVPPSLLINKALDLSKADYFLYLADDSLPTPHKIEMMAARLDDGASVVYCAQSRGQVRDATEWLETRGSVGQIATAPGPHSSPYCQVDMTQVMHVRSEDRWPLDMSVRKIGDAVFWNLLLERFGAFENVPDVLDWHRQLPTGITARW